ncbi:hypothetical protein [Thalassobellus suaedae]|uniref:Uncharacterized protein n=1 Tax=Thalassobellus suaedae TaxID=3074124 RepID=A0ABY9XVV0_9FLAO|nr:hypothetical protein RHP51_05135 [Flavobacteriaceae bacterium HL-DH14]
MKIKNNSLPMHDKKKTIFKRTKWIKQLLIEIAGNRKTHNTTNTLNNYKDETITND